MRKLEDERFEVQLSEDKKEGIKGFDNLYFLLKEIRKDIPHE